MNLRSPSKKQLHEGNTVKIHNHDSLVGVAKLLYRKPSPYREDGKPYVKKEKTNDLYLDTMYIWSYERWVVEWVSHSYYRPGDKNAVDVHYYVTTSSDYPSLYDKDDNNTAESSGRFFFTELDGVLITEQGLYQKDTVKLFNKIVKSFGGDLVVYGHNQHRIREDFDLYGVKHRILAFLNTDIPYEEAVNDFLREQETVIDYLILAGTNHIEHKRAINLNKSGIQGL